MSDTDPAAGRVPSPQTVIAPFLGAHPAAAKVFLGHRMACVGCSLAGFETLEDAAREYRLPLSGFLAELAGAAGSAKDGR